MTYCNKYVPSGIRSTGCKGSNLLNEKRWRSYDPSHHGWIVKYSLCVYAICTCDIFQHKIKETFLSKPQWNVVYLDQLLGAARTRKLVETHFLTIFNLFSSFQTFFSDSSAEIKKKCVLSYSLKLVDMQRLVQSMRGYLNLVFFSWF